LCKTSQCAAISYGHAAGAYTMGTRLSERFQYKAAPRLDNPQ
jgi:hypothetical protein